jgi:hypothetical protein
MNLGTSHNGELTKNANTANSRTLQWVVTAKWFTGKRRLGFSTPGSGTLWDFEDSDARLLRGGRESLMQGCGKLTVHGFRLAKQGCHTIRTNAAYC